ncbi:hypothetical protein GPALN_011626 [Globodera pallida]|uniref:BOWMAN_BIRK domain-containing protein n=1 Tax=Globodera pallida TaxID=36090 RepID=A0A183CKN2_GLOPA|nr:hypothetical protein GPALN_011626 [Globodera pallida]
MQRQFSLILLPVLFLLHFKIDEGFACGVQVYDDFGCTDLNSTVVPGGNCGPNNGDCVVCRFIFKRNCQIKTECSCFYCCNPKYAENCPDGCNDCVWDGKGDKACRESKNVQFYGCAKYFANKQPAVMDAFGFVNLDKNQNHE